MKVGGPKGRSLSVGPTTLPQPLFGVSLALYIFYYQLFCSEVVRETGGYMTRDGVANLNRVEYVMRAIGRMEDSIFKKRREDECRRRIRDEKRKHQNKNHRQFGDKARNEGRNEVNDIFQRIDDLIMTLSLDYKPQWPPIRELIKLQNLHVKFGKRLHKHV